MKKTAIVSLMFSLLIVLQGYEIGLGWTFGD